MNIHDNVVYSQKILSGWRGKLKGQPGFILGNGPSVTKSVNLINEYGFFSIGCNRIIKIMDPTILFWQDFSLEREYIDKSKALKVCRDTVDAKLEFLRIRVELQDGFAKDPYMMFGCSSSGAIAYQMAATMGCDPIITVGIDGVTVNNQTDFYGNNRFYTPHSLFKLNASVIKMHELNKIYKRKLLYCGYHPAFKQYYFDKVIESLNENKSYIRKTQEEWHQYLVKL